MAEPAELAQLAARAELAEPLEPVGGTGTTADFVTLLRKKKKRHVYDRVFPCLKESQQLQQVAAPVKFSV